MGNEGIRRKRKENMIKKGKRESEGWEMRASEEKGWKTLEGKGKRESEGRG